MWLAENLGGIAAIISLVALNVASKSRDEAKRAADAAANAVLEAKKANKLSRLEIFSPHFSNVDCFIKSFSSGKIDKDSVDKAKDSISHLQTAFPLDNKFKDILVMLNNLINDNKEIKSLQQGIGKVSFSNQAPANLNEIIAVFEEKKKQLSIG